MTPKRDTPPVALATLAAHGGRLPSERLTAGVGTPHIDPLVQTSVYDFASIADSVPALDGRGAVYARHGLPNEQALGQAVAALEGAEAGLATNSGMSAVAALLMAICRAGDCVVVQRDSYGGTGALLKADFARLGIEVRSVNAYDLGAVDTALDGAKALLVESISNPLMKQVDLEGAAAACKRHSALLVVDNTFATPFALQPLSRGADIVWHSVTKFLGGHHDLCAGALVGEAAIIDCAAGVAQRMGLRANPFESWLAVRGLRTLDVRMRRAIETTAVICERLADHPRVTAVFSADNCAMASFDTGSRDRAEKVVADLALVTLTPSLGGTTTTLSHPVTSSHKGLSDSELAEFGISPGLLRLSIGLEDADDIWTDLQRAL